MQTHVTEIAENVFRISTYHPDYGIQFNQFLIRDEQPFLMHTGLRTMFDRTLEGVRHVMDPARLRWVGFSHFEPDECGALNQWLAVAPQAEPVSGMVGAMVMLSDFADRPARALADNEVLVTGKHRLRFLAAPHVPHGWDAGLYYDETSGTLLCSDLFFQPGDPPPVTEQDIMEEVDLAIQGSTQGPLAGDLPYTPHTAATLERLAALAPTTLAAMHGSSFRGDGRRALMELSASLKRHLAPG